MQKTYSGSKVRQYVGQLSFKHGDISFDTESDDVQLLRNAFSFVDHVLEDLLPESLESHRRYYSWLKTCLVIDVFVFGDVLKSVDGYFKDCISQSFPSSSSTLKCFKRTFRGPYLNFFSPIFEVIDTFFELQDPSSFRKINTYVNFLRRLNLKELNLQQSCEEDYILFENNYPELSDQCPVRELADIVHEWFFHFTYNDFIPKHGPGSVAGYAGPLALQCKYTAMQKDSRLIYFSKYIGNIDDWCPRQLPLGLKRQSEIVCVPKSIITNRTISREPCALQYFQQGIRAALVRHIEHNVDMRKHIKLSNQEYSQNLARIGSIDGSFATIDLSSASDSVSLKLVKRLFRHDTALLAGLICTRSDTTLMPSGEVIKLQKFAPMGSATCFPIETIVFCACCELVVRRSGHRSQYCVYGDDIVIEEEFVIELIQLLEQCGFIVNHSKSFSGIQLHNFREACGGEYYDGESVRPLRIPRFFRGMPKTSNDVTANRVSSIIALCNTSFERGYVTLRNEILSQLKQVYPAMDSLPFCTDGSLGITTYDDCCTNWKVKQRFDVARLKTSMIRMPFGAGKRQIDMIGSTWRMQGLCIVAVTCTDDVRYRKDLRQVSRFKLIEEEDVRLFEWFRSRSQDMNSSKDEYRHDFENTLRIAPESSEIRPVCSYLRLRWIYI